ncbi:carboxypeptidase-like regulatory domain-containing protein [Aurantibacter sp.]|uniref:carboxypeptidase-like regulatory domain-containing protein n=1 Tax=Aurantibacter sp. TaxID=2807103 RepID=UPI00326577E3
MRFNSLLLFIFLISSSIYQTNAQTISSIIIDSTTQKPIPYVTVQWSTKKGAITNEEGRFSILLEENSKETDTLFISCMGYESIARPLSTFNKAAIYMSPSAIELKEVLVSNKNYTADEIIDLVNDNIEENYNFDLTKKRLFFRRSSFQRMLKSDFSLKKSTIKELNRKFLDSIINTIPENNSYYTEILGDLYGDYDEERQKLNLIKASELYDKNMELDFAKVEEKFNDILKKNIKTDSYFKIKSGLFGTKLDSDEIFEEDVDSTDVAAVNKQLAETKKFEEERKKNFSNYRRKTLGEIYNNLPITEDTDLNFLKNSGRYEFTLQEFTYLGDDAVYVIDFKPKRSEDYRGRLYINADDFALIQADYNNVKSIKTFNLLGFSSNQYLSNGKIIFSKGNDSKYELRYFESENGMKMGVDRPLKIIELNKVVKGKNKQNELSGNIDFALRNIDKNEVVIFESEPISEANFDSFKEKKDILPTYLPAYSAEFWSGYNIIEPNQAIKEFTTTKEN